MKIRNRSLMCFILMFSLIFSSLGVFAVEETASDQDDSIIMNGYKYFSDTDNGNNLSRVKVDENGDPGEDPAKETITTGSAIHLNINDGDNYFYYYLDDNDGTSSGLYRLDVDEDTNPKFISTKISIDPDSGTIVEPDNTISKIILTKNSVNDVMYFIESSVDTEVNHLRKLIIDGDNATLTSKFKYDAPDSDTEFKVKDIAMEVDESGNDKYLSFIQIIDNNEEKHQKLSLSDDIVSDIEIENISIKKQIGIGEDIKLETIAENTLSLFPGEEVTLIADIIPINVTSANLNWNLQNEDLAVLEPLNTNETKVTLKVSDSAAKGSINSITISDDSVTSSAKPVTIYIQIKEKPNLIKKVKFDTKDSEGNDLSKIIRLEKTKSITIPLKLIGENEENEVTNKLEEMEKIEIGPSENKYISVEKIIDETKEEVSIKITAKEETLENFEPMATLNITGSSVVESGDNSPPIIVTPQVNPIKKAEFNTTAFGKIIRLEKGDSTIIPLKLIGEYSDSDIEITDKMNEIEKIIVASTDSKYITAEKVVDAESGNVSVKITGKEVTPTDSTPMATVEIKDIADSKDESPIIIVEEMKKPNIKIQPIYLEGEKETDANKPVSLVKGKTRDFELFIEKDGKFEKIEDSHAEKIAWSTADIENKLINLEPLKGTNTKVNALGVGDTSLTATYKYDGEKTVDYKIDLTVIADEYGDYDKWTDEKTPTTVSPNKMWSVKFSNSIDEDSINSRTIYVKKRIGPNIEVLFDDTITYLGDNDKTINIKPTTTYDSGEYFLYIENIKDIYGRKLKNNLKMKFTVK